MKKKSVRKKKKRVKHGEFLKACPSCGSTAIQKEKPKVLELNLGFSTYRCTACGFTDMLFPKINQKKTKEFRKDIRKAIKFQKSDEEKERIKNIFSLEKTSYIFLALAGTLSLIYLTKNPEKEVITLTVFIWLIFCINFALTYHYNRIYKA